jgi:oligo-1,6-glucosidase
VGDLQGIISKLDYIKSIGVDAVWLNPIFKSPNDDGGYDISDYYSIQPEFGTIEDFDVLLSGLHQRGLKLIMDLVLNHSSDEHPWFVESRKSKDNACRDYYFWKKGKDGGPPNNWPSFFGGSAWELDDTTGEYYLHLFSKKQPDLNWENEALRLEVYRLMKFWLDKGVDGLRLDVISAISKRIDFPDTDTDDFNETIRKYYSNGPRLKEFISEARKKVLGKFPNAMTVGEGPGITPQNALDYLNDGEGLNMIFHFGHMFMDQGPRGRFDPIAWTMKDFKQVFKTWNDAFERKGWGSIFLGNHDFARMVSRWGNDREYWEKSSKLLITLLLSMRGTTFIFQGDEIGMTNTKLSSIMESKDIETQNGWRDAQKRGMTESEFIKIANYAGRDNARTPMQWSADSGAGFTNGNPWMPVNENKDRINVAVQEADESSILNYFRAMVLLRKAHPTLTYGSYQPIEVASDKIFTYFRESEKEKYQVVLNFSDESSNFPFKIMGKKLIGNYLDENEMIRPWEAIVINYE